ncbi:hypothetical protein BO78DRAFT_411735 [Aspergillus sclerotiicarbonarius CBS 121057]|uniref:CENP-V/GFA domain-containing protein n=1 Tax=Aspergillus sclerotiicarbonarius (strain CBS 121057 / IBT 28362) TaxID=1448318 RepID=A0A319EJP5_ASPSB|nr:hypothetical protein BO78DRAFT_411735 [Aspergillus sclerotiicarbonarius CBS 121057]
MAVGGCFCGKIRIEFNGQPLKSASTAQAGNPIYVINSTELKVSGNPKEVAKTADSGNKMRNYFCPDCGTPLFGRKIHSNGDFDEITIVRAGIFDDIQMLNEQKPEAELYTDRRLQWVNPVEGAEQFGGMLALS